MTRRRTSGTTARPRIVPAPSELRRSHQSQSTGIVSREAAPHRAQTSTTATSTRTKPNAVRSETINSQGRSIAAMQAPFLTIFDAAIAWLEVGRSGHDGEALFRPAIVTGCRVGLAWPRECSAVLST